MVLSWPGAFKKAIIAFLYAIFWIIFGTVVILAGTIAGAALVPGDPQTADLVALVISVIGMAIIIFGYSASIIKVAAD